MLALGMLVLTLKQTATGPMSEKHAERSRSIASALPAGPQSSASAWAARFTGTWVWISGRRSSLVDVTWLVPFLGRMRGSSTLSAALVPGRVAGGGMLLEAKTLVVQASGASVSARGGDGSLTWGGTIKLFYGVMNGAAPTAAGRIYDAGPGSFVP
ncbi:MAG: hypothetical protein U0359_08040 [Byssovorax sp.]